ncbi:cytochrome P450 [Eremomyces bilateralis CBS 781.70]|uniref:Cytochrome P450 n=1 Tax=Eremomyces bilateralis CBS 781.70 TaxID=1392243 RepID=A0A6G1FX85_9PEZI|nr:cytochrome P450 [Eremomyces bilateralis CBS 781.70]KAF1810322.1 cytochrome P450 [Eremomyces bilateralis CBS 781.70]
MAFQFIWSLFSRIFTISLLLLICAVVYQLSIYIYNVFFHPLRRYPGPRLCAASFIPTIEKMVDGEAQKWITNLHSQYGEVVRVAPNELSYSSAQSWKDIYGHRRAGEPVLTKPDRFYEFPDSVPSIVNAGAADHSRFRRVFSHAFSDKALKLQEPLFLAYVDKLVKVMYTAAQKDSKHVFDMVRMYNYTTFDVMGDLTFGESLDMLDMEGYHPWVAAVFSNFKFGVYLHSIRYYSIIEKALFGMVMSLLPPSLNEKRKLHHEFSRARVDRRLEKKDARPDIWGLVLQRDGESGLTRQEMYEHGNLFMIAGTETTATALSGLTWYLLKNPDKLKMLTEEIRGAFPSEDDITIERLQALKYLQGCVEEGLRMYPPISNGLPRVVPPEGVTIDGKTVPPGTNVYATHISVYRNPNNFRDPYSFIPERWFSDKYSEDKKHAFQPFSYGPRNCLGKNMAYHEIRIILAKVLWNFDLTLCPESENWGDQKTYLMWDKPQLLVNATPAARKA